MNSNSIPFQMMRENFTLSRGKRGNHGAVYQDPDKPWTTMDEPKIKILWPKAVDQKIVDVAMENMKLDGDVQTLAFLCGDKDWRSGDIHATHLIFPRQIRDPAKFEDKGKI